VQAVAITLQQFSDEFSLTGAINLSPLLGAMRKCAVLASGVAYANKSPHAIKPVQSSRRRPTASSKSTGRRSSLHRRHWRPSRGTSTLLRLSFLDEQSLNWRDIAQQTRQAGEPASGASNIWRWWERSSPDNSGVCRNHPRTQSWSLPPRKVTFDS